MKLRAKTATLVAGTFAALIAALYLVLSSTFIRSFDELEHSQATEATGRLQKAVQENRNAMLVQLTDWATWDDAYGYVTGKKPDFDEANLTQAILETSSLSFMIFTDVKGKIIRIHHPEGKPVPDSFVRQIVPGSRFLQHEGVPPPPWPDGRPRIGGIIDLGPEGAYLVGAVSITDGEASVPPMGTLVFGRKIDADLLERFSQVMLSEVTCDFLSSPTLGANFRTAADALQDEAATHIELINEQQMAGYCRVDDLDGKATAIFRLAMPRDVYQKGQATRRIFLISLAVAGAVSLLVTLALLDINVINRLRRLSQQALAIGRSKDFSGRVATRGSDELADLGGSVNEMLGALQQAEGIVRAAGAEMERILNTVTDGLFLLDRNLVIGSRYSKALETIFMRPNLANQPFRGLLEPALPAKTLEATSDYMAILFDPNVKEKLIQTLNPLREAEFNFPGEGGLFETRYLDFRFRRVIDDGAITAVMTSVSDITRSVTLARELKAAEERTNRQLEMMLSILHVDMGMVRDFLAGTREELAIIDAILREAVPHGGDEAAMSGHYRDRLRRIQRLMHAIKGNAALMKLRFFENSSHLIETRLKKLAEKPVIGGQDFLGVTLELATLHDHLAEAEGVIARLTDARAPRNGSVPGTPPGSRHPIVSSLGNLIQELAGRTGKQATLRAENFDVDTIPFRSRKVVTDMVVQLIRNSMRHGIEEPEQRLQRNKPPEGRLDLWTCADENYFIFGFRDDGSGLDPERIMATAARLGIASRDQTRGWGRDQVYQLIFQPGFTTAGEATTEGGMGVGLDFVCTRIAEMAGSILVESEPEQYCQFWIWIPKQAGQVNQPDRMALTATGT